MVRRWRRSIWPRNTRSKSKRRSGVHNTSKVYAARRSLDVLLSSGRPASVPSMAAIEIQGHTVLYDIVRRTRQCPATTLESDGGEGGFEPPVEFLTLRRFSKPLLSTTQPPLRCFRGSVSTGCGHCHYTTLPDFGSSAQRAREPYKPHTGDPMVRVWLFSETLRAH